MPGRRSFLMACSSLVAAPAFAQIAQRSAVGDVQLAISADAALDPPAINQDLALHVAGWEVPGEAPCATDAAPTISINSSWHAAWR